MVLYPFYAESLPPGIVKGILWTKSTETGFYGGISARGEKCVKENFELNGTGTQGFFKSYFKYTT